MRYEIKHIEIIDEFDPKLDSPQIVQCHVEIGDVGSSGADIFFVDVCNASWAEGHLDQVNPCIHRSILVLQKIDEKYIKNEIDEKFLSRDYGSFDELVSQAEPLLRWEFASGNSGQFGDTTIPETWRN